MSMDGLKIKNHIQENVNQTGSSTDTSQALEDHINTLTDIIIERILEERNKNTTV